MKSENSGSLEPGRLEKPRMQLEQIHVALSVVTIVVGAFLAYLGLLLKTNIQAVKMDVGTSLSSVKTDIAGSLSSMKLDMASSLAILNLGQQKLQGTVDQHSEIDNLKFTEHERRIVRLEGNK